MQANIKLFLGALAGIALFSAYGLYGSFAHSQLAQINESKPASKTPLPSPNEDPDHDGLTNEEESFWVTDPYKADTDGDGFKDGEEVLSEHDPLIPGPDDILPNSTLPQNITKKVSHLLVSGLVEGTLQASSSYRDAGINTIVDAILDQAKTNEGSYETPKFIIVANTSENIKTYQQKIIPILGDIAEKDLPGIMGVSKAVDSYINSQDPHDTAFTSFFGPEIQKLDQQIQTLQSMPVPQSWASKHNQIVYLLKKARTDYTLIQKIHEDPLQTIVALSDLSDILLDTLIGAIQEFNPLSP